MQLVFLFFSADIAVDDPSSNSIILFCLSRSLQRQAAQVFEKLRGVKMGGKVLRAPGFSGGYQSIDKIRLDGASWIVPTPGWRGAKGAMGAMGASKQARITDRLFVVAFKAAAEKSRAVELISRRNEKGNEKGEQMDARARWDCEQDE